MHADAMAGEKKKGACTHGAEGRRNCTETATGGRKARSGPWTVDRPFRRVLVATKADAGSVVGEPDPRSFSLDNAGRVKEGHGVAGSKLGIGCPAVAIEQGEEVLSSSGGASGCAATLPAPCSNAMLPIGSCLGFGGSVSTPLSLASEIMSKVKIWLPVL